MKIVVSGAAKCGIAICTYGSLAYVELGLAAIRRHEPETPILVHDDSSEHTLALRLLAKRYGADFVTTDYRRVPTIGDMSGFAEALKWGDAEGLDIVVKCSRRFILDRPWSAGLAELMHAMQYPTATAPCAHYKFGFRSELVAMHVPSWHAAGAYAQMAQAARENRRVDSLPEAWYHNRAREVHRFVHAADEAASHVGDLTHPQVDYLVRSEMAFPRPDTYAAFAWWQLMGLSRHCRMPGTLWHDSHDPLDYYRLAQSYELPWELLDFLVVPGE